MKQKTDASATIPNESSQRTPPHSPRGARDDRPSGNRDQTNPVRLIAFSALLLLLGARVALSGTPSENGAGNTTYAKASAYETEVFTALGKVRCRYSDERRLELELRELPARIESWRQTALVESSEILRSLQRIAELVNCPTAARHVELAAIEDQRDSLSEALERALRSELARLRRAQKDGDRAAARASVDDLEHLLEHHDGPLREHLARLARRYREE